MPRFSRLETLTEMERIGLVPVFYHSDVSVAVEVVKACADAGARVVEFTNRGDLAYRVFCELSDYCARELPHVILGVGSVVDEATAALYINSGANFVVGPIFNPEVAKICNRRKVPYSPGCGSASEISLAEEWGCEIVKLFPGAEVGGPSFVKALLAPCPWTKIMPTGGVDATEQSIAEWIKAGCACLGMGSKLITKEIISSRNYDALRARVEQCLWWIKKARGVPLFQGLDHVGLYPTLPNAGPTVADWYTATFPGLTKTAGQTSDFLKGSASGSIEVMHQPEFDKAHVAIRVANFEEAVHTLRERGIEVEEPVIIGRRKSAFLKTTDPAGHRVHIVYEPS
jgi:2-dehydro-3-deoxyphosphogluconate aldolase/(4S)-4-hydroxy-2-oxoglutarate aldolase